MTKCISLYIREIILDRAYMNFIDKTKLLTGSHSAHPHESFKPLKTLCWYQNCSKDHSQKRCKSSYVLWTSSAKMQLIYLLCTKIIWKGAVRTHMVHGPTFLKICLNIFLSLHFVKNDADKFKLTFGRCESKKGYYISKAFSLNVLQ